MELDSPRAFRISLACRDRASADVLIFFENQPTGVQDLEVVNIKVSPNPFQEGFTIDLSGIQGLSELALVDMKGRQVARRDISFGDTQLLWSPDISSGTYTLMDIANNRRLAVLIKH